MTQSVTAAESPEPVRETVRFPTFSPEEFKAAFRHHPGGVGLITAVGPDGPVAMTATSVASVSAEPALLVFSVSEISSSAPALKAAETVVVHMLRAADLPLARLGATSGIDRFADTTLWHSLTTGEPVFHGTRWLRCRIVNRFEAGTATLVVAQPIQSNLATDESDAAETGDGLVYENRTWHRIGEHSRTD
ncbi:MAG TPA: flavin reductase family protein [Microbacteriaceae bacterium]|nr:flavin reductase family protein [Microbacteriaceae bacterium]